jgi:hypothetical protein
MCRWLNTCFLVGKGEIDETREDWWLDVYVCVNEVAQGAPALGTEPPDRFRQRDAAGASYPRHCCLSLASPSAPRCRPTTSRPR